MVWFWKIKIFHVYFFATYCCENGFVTDAKLYMLCVKREKWCKKHTVFKVKKQGYSILVRAKVARTYGTPLRANSLTTETPVTLRGRNLKLLPPPRGGSPPHLPELFLVPQMKNPKIMKNKISVWVIRIYPQHYFYIPEHFWKNSRRGSPHPPPWGTP